MNERFVLLIVRQDIDKDRKSIKWILTPTIQG